MSLHRLCLILLTILALSESKAQIDTSAGELARIKAYLIKEKDTAVHNLDSAGTNQLLQKNKWNTSLRKTLDTTITSNIAAPLKAVNDANNKINKYNKKLDSSLTAIQEIPSKYIKQVDKKIDKYSNRLTSKTEKTLTKLSKWENKIKAMLDKASPETSAKLFGENQVTFTILLKKLKEGENIARSSSASYDQYRDKLSTTLKYLQSQKEKVTTSFTKPINAANVKMDELNQDMANTEAVEKIIKERKKQLIDESLKYIGKSKYLSKINKETYYYVETLRNYKEIFSDPKKAEAVAKNILNKIPAFHKFVANNSALASIFGNSNYNFAQNTTGLQTRSAINDIIQGRVSTGGPNAREFMQQGMQHAQGEMSKLKNKLLESGGSGNADDLPNFKPNNQKAKTFFQRLEYGGNYQFNKSTVELPMMADIAVNIGYKINDKSILGVGVAYKLGFGKIERIRLSGQGVGLRSFADWKLKKQFFISGGIEMNYNNAFKNLTVIRTSDLWQQAALLGISKKLKVSTKFFKSTNIQLMYDFLYKQHTPYTQPVVFRVGYSFK